MTAVDPTKLKGFEVDGITLKPFAGDKLMIVRVDAPRGTAAAAHSHPHEQISLVVAGRMRFRIGPDWMDVGPLQLVHIPPGMEHEAYAVETSVIFDIFHPVRDDFVHRAAEAP